MLNELSGFKFVIIMVLKLKKKTINKDETKHSNFYSNSNTETNIHSTDIDNLFKSIYSIVQRIQHPWLLGGS